MNTTQRQAIERKIAEMTAQLLIGAGYQVTVKDGEELVLEKSTDVAAILEAMFSTDEDYLIAYLPDASAHSGWVRFIYGNDGYDVINDYTTNLEPVMSQVNTNVEEMENNA